MVQSCGQRNDKKGFLNFGPKTGKNCGQFCYEIGKKLWSKNYSRICVKFWSNLLSKIWSAILGQNIGLKRVQNLVKNILSSKNLWKILSKSLSNFFLKVLGKNLVNILLQTFDPNLVKFFSSRNLLKMCAGCCQNVGSMMSPKYVKKYWQKIWSKMLVNIWLKKFLKNFGTKIWSKIWTKEYGPNCLNTVQFSFDLFQISLRRYSEQLRYLQCLCQWC